MEWKTGLEALVRLTSYASAGPFLKHFSHHAYNSRLFRSIRYNSSVDDPVFLDGNEQSWTAEGYGRGSRAACG